MKTFMKVFIVSFLCFFIAFFVGAKSYIKDKNISLEENIGFGSAENINISNRFLTKVESKPKEIESYSTLEEAFNESSRINFLILGMEDVRSDTMILASLSPHNKVVDLISIPRDTYIHRKGYDTGQQRKINSIYYSHGIDGVKKATSHIFEEMPIHHYIIVEYEGVKKIVDLIGGVEVDVPFHMKYKDPTDNPPLDIDIPEGVQILDGKKSLDFLRYRKGNNKIGYVDGDLGRIKAQQQFLKSFVSKALDNLITIIPKGYGYIKTDIKLFEALSYGKDLLGIKEDNVKFSTLPGKDDLREVNKKIYSYFIYNDREIKALLENIYNIQ